MTVRARKSGRRGRLALLVCGAVLAAALGGAASASAEQFTPHVLSGTFAGADSTTGAFGEVNGLAVDQQSGDVYVLTNRYSTGLKVYKFNSLGVATPFSSLSGSNVLTVTTKQAGEAAIAVDNSGGTNQGRIYVTAGGVGETWAFEPSGAAVGGKFPIASGATAIAVDPTDGHFWLNSPHLTQRLVEYLPDGTETANVVTVSFGEIYGAGVDPQGNVYTFNYQAGVLKYSPTGALLNKTAMQTFGGLTVNQVSGNAVFIEGNGGQEIDPAGNRLPSFAFSGSYGTSVAVNGVNGYLYASNGNSGTVSIFAPGTAVVLPDAELGQATNFEATSVEAHATANPSGVETTECKFEYGPTEAYGSTVPCAQGQSLTGNAPVAVSATLTGLSKGGTYHYRLSLANGNAAPNNTVRSKDATAVASSPPAAGETYVNEVHSDSGLLHAEVTPEGAPTTVHVLYGTANCSTEPGSCARTPESGSVGAGLNPVAVALKVTGLSAGTTYHYVFVFTNQSGTTESGQQSFTTFPYSPALEDHCPNAHVRQQTGAALLSDCRAYELVSAGNTGGYDVESYLVPGQEPFAGFPEAETPTRLLYGVHDGAIPGSGNPTNHGLDPYIATRGGEGWTTNYVGIPANLPYSAESFASPLAGADAKLSTFAFGGEDLCSPCFGDGTTGIPVRTANGGLVQGMVGSENPGPAAAPNMLVRVPVSANGEHLVFGSTDQFEAGAGSPAIYDRNLETGITHAVSVLPGGGPIPCLMQCSTDGLAELAVSADGSRIVIGQLVRVDSAGNRYWHLYMNIGDSSRTIDLTPGATDGATFAGMARNGAIVYFTTVDALTGEDHDHSADLYRADVSPAGATLTNVSIGSGGSGNGEACNPIGNSVDEHWNTAEAEANCGVVAVGGGGGVAAEEGGAYFLSPELLDGTAEPQDGVKNAPNLYLTRPGAAPRFVATLESSLTGPTPALEYHKPTFTFAATPNPRYVAVDDSSGPSKGDIYVVDGNEQVIRKYDSAGHLITSWQTGGKLVYAFGASISGIAVGSTGTLYVAVHQEINGGAPRIFEFDETGALIGTAEVEGAPSPIGISVDDEGWVYFMGYAEQISRWKRGQGTQIISTEEYRSGTKTALAVDPATGELFVSLGGESIARYKFNSSGQVIEAGGAVCNQHCEPTEKFGSGEVSGIKDMVVEPGTGDLYVDEGNKILRFFGNGRPAPGPATGAETLSNSGAVGVSAEGDLYATNLGSGGADVQAFGPLTLAHDPRTDSPLVVDSVGEPEVRHTGDFQVTPNGNDAVFVATIPFTGYSNAGHEEVFRYDATAGQIVCASCAPTGAIATGEAKLAPNGLSVTDNGTVFFDSTDPLTPRDLDNREDVYEWENGEVNLISTGISQFNSSLLTTNASGTDVFFFTRDSLVPQDQNGSLVKIYDARMNGGFPYTPPPPSCKASDECHGAGTPAPPPPNIKTVAGTRGNQPASPAKACKKGFVKRHGKCVKKTKKNAKGKKQTKRAGRAAGNKGGGH
ncbi:MAG: hypothetical protein JSU06_01305 [Actinobacteria bacterium]|nr:hypothetical protein [Actinomycetota bacterium]